MLTIPLDIARRIALRRCAAANVALLFPGDPRRTAVVMGVAAAHALQGTGITSDHVDQLVTTTLPGVPGLAADALAMIPVVGRFLAALGADNGRTGIYLSPAACATGVDLLATTEHELGHAGTIAAGGLIYCGVYLLVPEVRAGGEAPCYGNGMAVRYACGGDLDAAADDAKRSLEGYGLDAAALRLAHGIIDSAAASIAATGDHGGVVAELRAELAAEGITLPARAA